MDSRTVSQILSVSALAYLSIASQVALAASDAGTLQLGHGVYSGCSTILSGYNPGASFGSYSPTGLAGGETVETIIDSISLSYPGCPDYSELAVSGFSSNPGVGWLTSITCNGVTNPASSATYAYLGGGQATWQWSTLFNMTFNGTGGLLTGNVSCTIVHN